MTNAHINSHTAYIAEMTEKQKITFLKVIAHLAVSDNNFADEEKEKLNDIAVLFNIPETRMPEILEPISLEDLLKEVSEIKSRSVALHLVKEACLLASLNGSFSEEELTFIGQLGQALNVELEKIEQISRWVLDRLIWLEEEKLIFEQ